MNPSRPHRTTVAGFTLIEAMITVSIVAIIAAIAIPSYVEYVTRSKIVEATAGLADMRTRIEQYFFDTRAYPTACIAAAAGPAGGTNIYLPAATKFFTFTCAFAVGPPATYTVTATGLAAQGMTNFIYTINQANTRTTTSTGSWGKSSGVCWVIKKDGSC